MSEIKWTAKRHDLLREIADGDMTVYVGINRNLVRESSGFLRNAERKDAFLLSEAWTYGRYPGMGGSAPAKLTDAGRALLAEWNSSHPQDCALQLTAKQITEDIKWLLSDAGLDRHPDFKVKTSRKGDRFETVIYAVDAQRALVALADRFKNVPDSSHTIRDFDGYLAVHHPANPAGRDV
jgi:hypothetical protein